MLHAIIAFIVQAFFCTRMYRLTRSRLLTIGCGLLACGRIALALIVTSDAFDEPDFLEYRTVYAGPLTASLSVIVGSDIINASALAIALWRNRTGFKGTDTVIDKIVSFVLGTGLLSSMGTLAQLITLKTMPNFVWLAILIVFPKIFSNSLFVSLNERKSLRTGIESALQISHNTHTFTDGQFQSSPTRQQFSDKERVRLSFLSGDKHPSRRSIQPSDRLQSLAAACETDSSRDSPWGRTSSPTSDDKVVVMMETETFVM